MICTNDTFDKPNDSMFCPQNCKTQQKLNTYHFGFYYHLICNNSLTKQELVLIFREGIFEFWEVKPEMIPYNLRRQTDHYFDLSMPILCSTQGETISEIIFLKDIPSSKEEPLKGFSLDFIDEKQSFILLYNKDSFCEKFIKDDKESQFGHLLVNFVGIRNRISYLEKVVRIMSPDTYQRDKDLEKITKEILETMESHNLEKALASLSVTVTDFYRNKVGGDDTYTIYREAHINDESVNTDDYIEKIIGIGSTCIHSERGYTSNLKAYAPDIFIGKYLGDNLEKEKERIRAQYSRDSHIVYTLFSKLNEKDCAIREINDWKAKLSQVDKTLQEDFCLNKLSRLDERFFRKDSREDISDFLVKINNLLKRIVLKYPYKYVIISGWVPPIAYEREKDAKRNELVKKIHSSIETLLKTSNVTIVTGNAAGAESIALKYALDNKILFINGYTEWTMLNKDYRTERYYEMLDIAEVIYLTQFEDSYLYKNFVKVANELDKPIHIL